MKIMVNGWDLATGPQNLTGLFLQEWLQGLAFAKPELRLQLVVPKELPAGVAMQGVDIEVVDVKQTPAGQIWFEQRILPRLAARAKADLLLFPAGGAPVLSPVPIITYPRLFDSPSARSLLGRLGWGLRRAGTVGAALHLLMGDTKESSSFEGPCVRLPSWVSQAFNPLRIDSDQDILAMLGLEVGYALGFAHDRRSYGHILDVWRWLSESIDIGRPLALAGLSAQEQERVEYLATDKGVIDSIRLLRGLKLSELPAVLRQASFYFHGAPSPHGQELRWAMACGTPVVGIETEAASRILRQAGYLASPADIRSLAAACMTVLVEDKMAEHLRQQGLSVAREFHQGSHFDVLEQALNKLV